MIKITQGSETEVKKEMKAKTAEIREEMKKLRKKLKGEKSDSYLSMEIRVKLDKLEESLRYYSPSRVLPVEVGNIVINYKALHGFLKAIKDLSFKVSLSDSLRLDYSNGFVEFDDLSQHYQGFQFIPKATIASDIYEQS